MFMPVSTVGTDTTNESCAMDYENRDTNELQEMEGRRFSQEFLEVSLNFRVSLSDSN